MAFIVPTKKNKVSRAILTRGMSATWLKLESKGIENLLLGFAGEKSLLKNFVAKVNNDNSKQTICLNLISFLKKEVGQVFAQINQLNSDFNQYTQHYSRSKNQTERRQYILEFAKTLGADNLTLREDKKAFSRWFGHDAICDRCQQKIAELEKYQSLVLERLGVICRDYLGGFYENQALTQASCENEFDLDSWKQLGLEETVLPGFIYSGDGRVRINAFKCLSLAISGTPQGYLASLVSDNSIQFIYRAALDHRLETWIQTEALNLLSRLSADDFTAVFQQRFKNIGDHNDIFVRYQAVILLGKFLPNYPAEYLLKLIPLDPSPYVRQALTKILAATKLNIMATLLATLVFEEPVAQVRASALLSCAELFKKYPDYDWLTLVIKVFQRENNELVLHTFLTLIPDWIDIVSNTYGQESVNQWIVKLMPELARIYQHNPKTKIRRWTAKTRERLWCYLSKDRINFFRLINKQLDIQKDKGQIRFQKRELPEDEMVRILAILAQDSFGYDIKIGKNKFKYYKKPNFTFRFWRFLYELRNPSTEKRQAYSHTIGRLNRSSLLLPSNILAELSETKVPGEPLYFSDEDGWRAYLPLVDDIVFLLDPLINAMPLKIVTADGITHLHPPKSVFKRMLGLYVISNRFEHFSRLRNWQKGSSLKANAYISELRKLGIHCDFQPHSYANDKPQLSDNQVTDSQISRFFNFGLPFPLMDWFDSFRNYFYSVYQNSIADLFLFLAVLGSFFIARHSYLNAKIRNARNSIALVIGGWGTRGKSGTERLKAAVLNALGYSIVSKTTGCEAMFLQAHEYGSLREMFLFRPYDKATIWEQSDVLNLAKKLKAEVFLWECMGLTPAFIDILQRQWMRDDIATITNTYPDHEDLQGPAGYNIPQVMTQFIPQQSTLITSEEQMLPILQQASEKRRSQFISVGWQDAGLLTEDVLQRFPYDEHPYNIALVLKMSENLGIEHNFALKEMADRVVPDLGVLKTYPTAMVNYRYLTFVMGMSANERFGAMGNWTRSGFDQYSMDTNPDTWITALVNNRADRIARSRVFADVVIKDINYDRLILIGTNLSGLKGYIEEAWEKEKQSINIWQENTKPIDNLNKIALRFRVPNSEQQLQQRIGAFLVSLENQETGNNSDQDGIQCQIKHIISEQSSAVIRDRIEPYLPQLNAEEGEILTELVRFIEREKLLYLQYAQIREKLKQNISDSSFHKDHLNQEIIDLIWTWIIEKIVIIEDEHASGNEVIQHIVKQTPPGAHNQIMGMQNIKGTGLDYVYHWLAWDSCYKAIIKLKSDKIKIAREGLTDLVSFQDFNRLCTDAVQDAIAYLHQQQWTQKESIQAEINLLQDNFEKAMKDSIATSAEPHAASFFIGKTIEIIEFLLDSNDAVKRRKKADVIYKDLINQRISIDRAVIELKLINKRQKGGWLKKKFFAKQTR